MFGDVYQYETLLPALGDSNVVFIATGARPSMSPDSITEPFRIDYNGACVARWGTVARRG